MQMSSIEQVHLKCVSAKTQRCGVPLSVRDLSKSFAGRVVLKPLDLDIAAGEFVAVVGRSGCGKSTLLRLIADLEVADQGEVILGAGPARPEVRIMFQDARLLPWKRVLQNVALGLPDASDAARVALQNVGLHERAGDWPAVLSGGQKQRVALARALAHDPQLLLLDEPLGALDALTRMEMQELIETLWRQRGFTALLVTHDVQEAVSLADRVVLIEDGAVTLDLPITLPRPRVRGSAEFAYFEARILDRILKSSSTAITPFEGDRAMLEGTAAAKFALAV
jgi:sulfonate transport system ATP-binding protein